MAYLGDRARELCKNAPRAVCHLLSHIKVVRFISACYRLTQCLLLFSDVKIFLKVIRAYYRQAQYPHLHLPSEAGFCIFHFWAVMWLSIWYECDLNVRVSARAPGTLLGFPCVQSSGIGRPRRHCCVLQLALLSRYLRYHQPLEP